MTFEQQQAELMADRDTDRSIGGVGSSYNSFPVSIKVAWHQWTSHRSFPWCFNNNINVRCMYSKTAKLIKPVTVIFCFESTKDAVLWKLRWGET